MTTGLVGQNQIAPFTSPIPGGSLDATVVLGNDNSTVTSYDAHDNDSTIHFQSSTLANRPPASTAGQKWLTTDAAARYIYYDSGSAWVEVNYFRDSGGIITGAVTISDTTESTSTTTGALIVSGGVGIAKNVFIGGTLGVTGVATFTAKPIVSTLTASQAVFSDSVKGLVSNALTGTGNVVMSASPTLTGTIGAASMTLSGTLGVTGVATFTAQPIVSSLTASKPVFTDASKGLVSTGTLDTTQGGTNLTTYTTGDILYASATNVLSKLAIGTTGQHLIVTAGLPSWSTDSALGTVTSVSFTGGLISVATATTTPALTVAGTSGGVVYFSSASTWASSAALTASAIVLGGGAGAAPATTTTGTGVVTALGVNVGTAGAFVVNGGALGTPSSGAVAASLITAGTFGAGAYTFPGALAITGALTGVTALTASTSVNVTKAGSDTAFSGPYLAVSNATNSKTIGLQLDSTESKLKWFYYPGNALMATLDSGGSLTLAGALAIAGALTGVTTLTASSTATIGAAASPLLIGRLADYTTYGAISFNGSLTSTTMNGLFGRLSATDGGLWICAPSGSATQLQVAGSTVATFAGALTTLATPLAITGAFTGATTGTFSTSAAIPITGVRTDAAGVLGVFEVKRSATTIGYIGMDASDNFALISGAGAVVGLKMSSAGLITIPGAATFSSSVAISVAASTSALMYINATTAGYGATINMQTGGVTKWSFGLNHFSGTGEWGLYNNAQAVNVINITNAATAAITLTGTLAVTGDATFGGAYATSLTSGDVAIPNAKAFKATVAAGNSNRSLIGLDASDIACLSGATATIGEGGAPRITHRANTDLIAASAGNNGLVYIDSTNGRFIFHCGGLRYYVTGTSF